MTLKKVTLNEIMNFEDSLLQINFKYNVDKKNISFGDYITLKNCLKTLGDITTEYFTLVEKNVIDEDSKKYYKDMLMSEVLMNDDCLLKIDYLIKNYPY